MQGFRVQGSGFRSLAGCGWESGPPQPGPAVLHALRAFVPTCLRASQRAFTIVELIVVITVIVLILAVAVPGLSAMNAQARLMSAQQLINGVTTRAYFLALADRSMTAVRFFPGIWDTADSQEKQIPGGRQHLAIYSYVGTAVQETFPGSGSFVVKLGEYFERAKNVNSVLMPEDVWAAPIEALQAAGTVAHSDGTATSPAQFGQSFVLNGTIGKFAYNADRMLSGSDGYSQNFLNADDFLIVCDPDTGVYAGTPRFFRLRAYSPTAGYEADCDPSNYNNSVGNFQRCSFGGLITYRREPFLAVRQRVGSTAKEVQDYLRYEGRPYMVHRFSGGLMSGAGRP